MNINRRDFLTGTAALLFTAAHFTRRVVAAESPAIAMLDKSRLIYLTPLIADGRESTCHGEVWFVHHVGDIFVCTPADTWRSEAVRRGFKRAKIWIGEFGVWSDAGNRYRSAPYLEIEGRLETDAAVHTEVLAVYGQKYVDEWDKWGPRFRDGLADGSRVLLRYQVVS